MKWFLGFLAALVVGLIVAAAFAPDSPTPQPKPSVTAPPAVSVPVTTSPSATPSKSCTTVKAYVKKDGTQVGEHTRCS